MLHRVVVAAVVIGAVAAGRSEASLLVTVTESGGDVVFSGGGTLDLTGLSFLASGSGQPGIKPSTAYFKLGPASLTGEDVYFGVTSPSDFGTGGPTPASSGSGDNFGVSSHLLIVPTGYTSGSPLLATDTFAGATFASLGITPGTYIYTLPSDTITLQIGPTAVPEPSTLLSGTLAVMLTAGVGLARGKSKGRSRKSKGRSRKSKGTF